MPLLLLCRNKVAHFDTWWKVFESHAKAHRAAGLDLKDLWRNADDPDEAFFVFRVEDRARALEFMNSPESSQAGRESGVIEGDYYFVEEVGNSLIPG